MAVGGRDQLKKIKATFDHKTDRIPIAVKTEDLKKEVSVQIEANDSPAVSFSFESPKKNASTQC